MTGGSGWHTAVTAARTNRPAAQIACADRLFYKLWTLGYTDWHGGDCAGGDAQLYHLAAKYFWLHGHPGNINRWREFLSYHDLREAKDPLERNRDMISESHFLVALPDGYSERVRSGTWSTIRYAVKLQRSGYVIYPDASYKPLAAALG